MSEEIIKTEEVIETPVVDTPAEAMVETPVAEVAPDTLASEAVAPVAAAADAKPKFATRRPPMGRGGAGAGKGGPRRDNRGPRAPREKPEFDQKTLDVRRVTRVVSGGRRFSLHVTLVAGDKNGRVGLGTGKATDTQAAMAKALKSARKNMIKLNLTDNKSIVHEVEAKYDTAKVWISPNKGKGLIAGSSARVILNLAGAQNVTAKFHGGTKNKLNNARATMKALAQIATIA
jgi:small subunit ribosomal protein S5